MRFHRLTSKLTQVAYGEIQSEVLNSFSTVLKEVLTPAAACQDWGKCGEEEQHEFNDQLERFNHTLNEAAMSLRGGIELCKPDPERAQSPSYCCECVAGYGPGDCGAVQVGVACGIGLGYVQSSSDYVTHAVMVDTVTLARPNTPDR